MAVDLEWSCPETRDFDEISPSHYTIMRDSVARAWPLAARYFDGAWLIKRALRTTWGYRRKASVREDRCKTSTYVVEDTLTHTAHERRQRALAGFALSEEDMPTASVEPSTSSIATWGIAVLRRGL
jgi:hypothetical protein